jgi:hypothetical protein
MRRLAGQQHRKAAIEWVSFVIDCYRSEEDRLRRNADQPAEKNALEQL